MAPGKPSRDSAAAPAAAIKARARQLGFELVGIAPAERPEHGDFYLEWLEREYNGEMAYLARDDAVARRLSPV
jgi:epoxyqueuosine reductase